MDLARLHVGHADALKDFNPSKHRIRGLTTIEVRNRIKADTATRLKGKRDACKHPRVGDQWEYAKGKVATVVALHAAGPRGKRPGRARIEIEFADETRELKFHPAQWTAWCHQCTRFGGVVGERSAARVKPMAKPEAKKKSAPKVEAG